MTRGLRLRAAAQSPNERQQRTADAGAKRPYAEREVIYVRGKCARMHAVMWNSNRPDRHVKMHKMHPGVIELSLAGGTHIVMQPTHPSNQREQQSLLVDNSVNMCAYLHACVL